MVFSALAFSVMSLLVKLAGERLPAVQIVLARSFVSLVITWVLMRRMGLSWRGNRPGLLVVRGLFGLGGLTCLFWALTRLTLADATVLHFTNPVFTALLAAWLLGETLTVRHGLALVTCVVGVTLVAQPAWLFGAGAGLPWDGVVVALLGAVSAAAAYVTVRKLGETESPLVVVFYFPLVAVPLISPFAVAQWVWPTPVEWGILLGVGLATQVGQISLTRGLHRLPAGTATAIGYLQIVFATLLGWWVFDTLPTPLAIGGAVLIVAGVLSLRPRRGRRRTPRVEV